LNNEEFVYLYFCIFVSQQMASGYDAFLYVMHYCIRTYSTQTHSTLYFINFMFICSKFHLFWIQQTFDDKQHKQNEALVFFYFLKTLLLLLLLKWKVFYLFIFSMQKKRFFFFLLFFLVLKRKRTGENPFKLIFENVEEGKE
jgi:hypothetical protein